jgi:selenium metabolism protein YedF
MEIIDVMGRPCPIPVIEAKKALAKSGADGVVVKVDNIVAVQNLEKMAKGYGYGFSYEEKSKDTYEVSIQTDGKAMPAEVIRAEPFTVECRTAGKLVVVISGNAMGNGSRELGEILIKGFIYALTEQAVLPATVIFLNSGAYLTTEGANTIPDLKKLEEKGATILTCGTCANYFGLTEKLAVGRITDMYGIVEEMTSATNVINI